MSLVGKIEDLIIKTMIAGELPITTACKTFMPFPGNCFEIYGFDVLIDENLKPWLLEVNLSPSMACDSPMDLKIKSNLLTDMFNLTGFLAQDPLIKKVPIRKNVGHYVRNQYQRQRCHSTGLTSTRPLSGSSSHISGKPKQNFVESERGLSTEELRVLRETKDEYLRRGSFVRIFPSPNSRELYGSYLEHRTTNNRMLSSRLFMENASRKIPHTGRENNLSDKAMPTYQYGQTLPERMVCYERQLPSLVTEQQKQSPQMTERVYKTDAKYPGQNSLTQGQLEVRSSQLVTSSQPNEAHATTVKGAAMENSDQTVEMEDVIEKAASLSELQARKAFGMYLQRVKQRLIKEVSCDYDDSGDEGEKAKQDEQMNLVIRFLKKAARNLRQEFKVVIPSYKLPMHDRRRILAQQLGDFVHIYDRETAQMKDQGNVRGENGSLSEKEFKIFLAMASESELEELLTEYTKVNNNANIFLGNSASKPTSSSRIMKPALQRQTETRKHFRSHSAHALTTTNTQEVKMKQKSDQAVARMSDQNRRLAGAVAAYGKSLAFNAMRKRPASASISTERKRLSATSLVRPMSAKVSTNQPVLSTVECDSSHALTNEKSVSDVLKKLARRQAIRQYEAKLALNIETNHGWVQPAHEGMVENAGMDQKDMNMENYKTEKVRPSSQLESRNSNANETFFNFVNYESSTSQRSRANVPYENQVSRKQHLERFVRESPAVVGKAFSASEIRIPCGESEVGMEDKLGSTRGDYNKHMQLLIERLAAHKFNKTSKEDTVVPKPPSRPRSAKQPVSAQRMSRITSRHGSRE